MTDAPAPNAEGWWWVQHPMKGPAFVYVTRLPGDFYAKTSDFSKGGFVALWIATGWASWRGPFATERQARECDQQFKQAHREKFKRNVPRAMSRRSWKRAAKRVASEYKALKHVLERYKRKYEYAVQNYFRHSDLRRQNYWFRQSDKWRKKIRKRFPWVGRL